MKVGIVGAGFAGLAAAIAFRQNGHDVTVFERGSGPLVAGGAIALAPNALACLSILGVEDQIVTEPWSRMPATVRTSDGRVLVRRSLAQLTGGTEFAAVPRAQLIAWLAAKLPSECVQYGASVSGVGADGTVEVGGGAQRFDLVVGADGVRSVTKRSVFPDAPSPQSTGISGWAWIVDDELATGFGPIWGRTADFGILPLIDGRTYVYGSRSGHNDLGCYRHWAQPLPALMTPRPRIGWSLGDLRSPATPATRPGQGRIDRRRSARHATDLRPGRRVGHGRCSHPRLLRRVRSVATMAAHAGAVRPVESGGVLRGAGPRDIGDCPQLEPSGSVPDALFGVMAGAVSHWRPRPVRMLNQ